MKKLLSFVLSFSLIFGVCSNACYAVDSNNAVSENVISEEMQQYYYEDALSRTLEENQDITAYSSTSSDSTINYFNGGLETDGDFFIQTVIEVQAVDPGTERIRYVVVRDYWYAIFSDILMATVTVNASFHIIQDVSVEQYNSPKFSYEIEPPYDVNGRLFVNEGSYSVKVSANKKNCTLEYKYSMDHEMVFKSATIKIGCDAQANVTAEDGKYQMP